jgi:hypothetical protein
VLKDAVAMDVDTNAVLFTTAKELAAEKPGTIVELTAFKLV